MSEEQHQAAASGIAIIGMAGRFPGADSIEEFWQMVRDGREGITFFDEAQLAAAGVDRTLRTNPRYVGARGVIANVEDMDAAFFGFTPREAALMDPQHRVFLECAWEALEHAGYDANTFDGRTGVFAGAGLNTYLLNNLLPNRMALATVGAFQLGITNDKDFLATRASYKLNLQGPSINVNTACSTSLVATQMAYQSLLTYQCDLALAGGVTIQVPHHEGYLYEEGGILSPDGHCRPFDANARGTISSSGAGLVVMKRLDEALADGDTIYAVITGAAVNNDGDRKVGYTAPSVEGQIEVIAEAQALAGVTPDMIGYVETHGTGTLLGDPIECAALTQAFRAHTDRSGFCAIGSLKSNLGHTDSAAGVLSLIKTVLALHHQMIPPSLHVERPNPALDLDNSPLYVNTELRSWIADNGPRRAGVSSFGIGGTNAHVIVEEAPSRTPSDPSRPWHLLVVSARTPTALDMACANLLAYLRDHPDVKLADVAYTLQRGRRPFPHRCVLTCENVADATAVLDTPASPRLLAGMTTTNPQVMFMFAGGGAQHIRMGADLYASEAVFRTYIDRCAGVVQSLLNYDLRHYILLPDADLETARRDLERPSVALPTLFAVQYAMAHLLMERGVRPNALIGHSLGEYVAACLAKVFSLDDALALVAKRGQLFEELDAGAMLGVPLGEPELQPLLTEHLSIAASNAPHQCVVAGPHEDIDAFMTTMRDMGHDVRRLRIDVAAHSAMVEPILERFKTFAAGLTLNEPQIPYVSNVTGTWITPEDATSADYWTRHLRQTVRFADGIAELMRQPEHVLLEVGPGRTLRTLATSQRSSDTTQLVLSSMRHPSEQQSDVEYLLTALGKLWLVGVAIDWKALWEGEQRHRLALPTYPFERQRYWIEPPAANTPNGLSIVGWKTTQMPLPTRDTKPSDGPWLLCSDEYAIGARLADLLRTSERQVITLLPGTTDERTSDTAWTLRPAAPAAYERLLAVLDRPPSHIVHLWSLSDDPDAASEDRGWRSLLSLRTALATQTLSAPVHITLVTSRLHAMIGETQNCARAALLAAGGANNANMVVRTIDVSPQHVRATDLLARRLLAELTATDATDISVAYRGTGRWVPVLDAITTPTTGAHTDEATYVVAGALSDANRSVIRHLVGKPSTRVAVIVSPCHAEDADVRSAQYCVVADPWDATMLRSAFDQVEQELGTLRGVFFAPPEDDAPIAAFDPATWERALARTTTALEAIHHALHDRTVGFCFFHAIADTSGTARQAALDTLWAFVHNQREAHCLPWSGGEWRNWPVASGDAAASARIGIYLDIALDTLRCTTAGHIVLDLAIGTNAIAFADSIESGTLGTVEHRYPGVHTPYIAPRTPTEMRLATIWQQTLGIARIGVNDNFYDLGGQSLLAAQLRNQITDSTGVGVPIRVLLEHPTIAELATLIDSGSLEAIPDTQIDPLAEQVRTAFPTERRSILRRGLQDILAQVFDMDLARLPADSALSAAQLEPFADQIGTEIKRALAISLTREQILAHPSIDALTDMLMHQLDAADHDPNALLGDLSDDEVEAMLQQLMEERGR